MGDHWDDNAPIDGQHGGYENRPINSQNFSNSNFRGARGNGRNYDRNAGYQRNSRDNYHGNGENSSNRSDGLYRNNRFRDNKPSWGNSSNSYESGQSETLNVPSRFVGRIIGRGGSKINELQGESGARIQVTKEIVGDETVVKIFGSPDSIEKAKSLISSLTTDQESRW